MKKIFFTLLFYFYIFIANAGSIKDGMLPDSNAVGVEGNNLEPVTNTLIYIKDFLFSILGLVAVGVFLYFGFKLVTARGNEEEFKKALMGFVYAVVGLAIIPLAWGAVKIISTLNF